jgi:glutamate/tyrosine decarboxylase-like PLP-dependent enzyme
MPPQADKLMQENISKNLIDQDEYPMTREICPENIHDAILITPF